MVKHAADRARRRCSPPRSGSTRPSTASSPDRQFTEDQAKWLEYIRQHLVAEPVDRPGGLRGDSGLSDHGGWGRANRVFDGQLAELLEELNEELVAA